MLVTLRGKGVTEQMRPQSKNKQTAKKRGKTRATKSWLDLVLHVIALKSGVSFLDQSQSEVMQNQCNPELLSTQLRIVLNELPWELCFSRVFINFKIVTSCNN